MSGGTPAGEEARMKSEAGEKPFQRLRFGVAHWLDRDPRRCWTSLCTWALYGETTLREASQRDDPRCAALCYCGKNNDRPADERADDDLAWLEAIDAFSAPSTPNLTQ